MVGKQIGDYEVIGEIGEGGMGKVYLARNVHLHAMQVVLKILKDSRMKERFLGEASTLSRLDHPNICQLKHFLHVDNELVLAIQYIDGQTLARLIEKSDKLDLKRIKEIGVQILDGLAYAHDNKVYHRDIKPANIMLDRSGIVKIIDFGIARYSQDTRYTMTGMSVGTPQYMAPEQFISEKIEDEDYTRCDIYSLGICLYLMCCGRLPFEETNPFILKDKHCSEIPPRPSTLNPKVYFALEKVILQAMAKNPNERFANAHEMKTALSEARPDIPPVRPITNKDRKKRTRQVRKDGADTTDAGKRRYGKKLLFVLGVAAGFAIIGYTAWKIIIPPAPHETTFLTMATQTIEEGGAFARFDLPKTLPPNDSLAVRSWIPRPGSTLKAMVDQDHKVSLTVPDDDWSGTDTIVFLAQFSDGARDSVRGIFTVIPVNDPPHIVGDIVQEIMSKDNFEPIMLDRLVSDPDNRPSELSWDWQQVTGIEISISDDHIMTVLPNEGWTGNAIIPMVVTDPAGGKDSISASFTVRAVATGYLLRVYLRPSGGVIYDPATAQSKRSIDERADPGMRTFELRHRDFPIQQVQLDVNADIERTYDLMEMTKGTDVGMLAVSIETDEGNLLSENIRINGFSTDHACMDSMRTMLAGEYIIGIDLDNNMQIDRVRVDDIDASHLNPRISIRPGKRAFVDFFVSIR